MPTKSKEEADLEVAELRIRRFLMEVARMVKIRNWRIYQSDWTARVGQLRVTLREA